MYMQSYAKPRLSRIITDNGIRPQAPIADSIAVLMGLRAQGTRGVYQGDL